MKPIQIIIAIIGIILLVAGIIIGGKDSKNRALQSNPGEITGTEQNMIIDDQTNNVQTGDIQIETVKAGTGDSIQDGQTAVVHYTGTFADGTVFDSSKTRNTPFEFVVGAGQVISGWDIGVKGMQVGEVRKLVLPPQYAYGEQGVGPIPPNTTLYFEVELLGIK